VDLPTVFSQPSAVIIFMKKNAFLKEFLETCTLYFITGKGLFTTQREVSSVVTHTNAVTKRAS
jgi:hypothetical protein